MGLIYIIDILSGFIIGLTVASHALKYYSTGLKVGFILCMLGLFYTGVVGLSGVKSSFPYWVLKDLGIACVAWFWLRHKLKGLK